MYVWRTEPNVNLMHPQPLDHLEALPQPALRDVAVAEAHLPCR